MEQAEEIFIKSIFRKYAVDESNSISFGDLTRICEENGINFDDDEMKVLRHIVDDDGNGIITYDEFKDFWMKTQKLQNFQSFDRLKAALQEFGKFDANGDGEISFDEFKEIAKAYGWAVKTEEEQRRCMEYMDKNNDGVISFSEFVEWLNWGFTW